MRLGTALRAMASSPTERLERLAIRLDFSQAPELFPRHVVRLVWLMLINEIIKARHRFAVANR